VVSVRLYQLACVCLYLDCVALYHVDHYIGLVISLSDPRESHNSADTDGSADAQAFGVLLSLLSRFMSSLNTILAERY
jgi:hypothetical protein